jgi:colanic acid biosynthesis glycosyl transferase WcaI
VASQEPRRPRLLVLNQYYRPGLEATAGILTELCEGLADEYDVTVVAGTVAGAAGPGRERTGGVDVVRVSSTAFARRRLWRRAANYASFLALALAAGLRAPRPDLVLTMTDPPLVPLVGGVVARRFRAPLVVVSQDVFPEAAVAFGHLRSPVLTRLAGAVTAVPLRGAAAAVAIGETMRGRLVAKGVAPVRVHVIGNWVDTERIEPAPRDNAWARRNGLAGSFVVMHSGNVGYAQDLESLVRAGASLRDLPDVRLVVVGAGARHADLVALARELEVDVTFLPYQPREVLSESLSTGAVHVVGLARGLAGYVVPSRLYGVLAAGRPVIAAAEEESETARLVRRVGCGVVLPPGRPDLLAATIRDARAGALDLDGMGRRGREWVVAHGDRRAALERYRALLREVRSAPGAS